MPRAAASSRADAAMLDDDLSLVEAIRERAHPISGADDLTPLIDLIADRRCVLLGEASHGTEEYYTWRSKITRRLIAEHGFRFVAVEGDWGSCRAVDRYIRLADDAPATAREALDAFTRWPEWLWKNQATLELVEWLREHNAALPPEERVGFYGVDLYGLADSLRDAPRYLATLNEEAGAAAREAYDCLRPYADEPRRYVVEVVQRGGSCAPALQAVVDALRTNREPWLADNREAYRHAKQNALVTLNAEAHFRAMLEGGSASWNIRARHFHATVARLLEHYGDDSRGVVWAHNTHIGDARATAMADQRMVNIGQLIRESHEAESVALVGFATQRGEVVAGARWGATPSVMPVPIARPGSLGHLLHRVSEEPFLVVIDDQLRAHEEFARRIGHRAIGVTYSPSNERGNYVPTHVPDRYDALIYIPVTTALRPLEPEESPDP